LFEFKFGNHNRLSVKDCTSSDLPGSACDAGLRAFKRVGIHPRGGEHFRDSAGSTQATELLCKSEVVRTALTQHATSARAKPPGRRNL